MTRPAPSSATVTLPVPPADRVAPLRDYRERPFEATEVRYRIAPPHPPELAEAVVEVELTAFGEPSPRTGYTPRMTWRAGYDRDGLVVRPEGAELPPAWLPRAPEWWATVVDAFVAEAALRGAP